MTELWIIAVSRQDSKDQIRGRDTEISYTQLEGERERE